ncbi:MULTISPECIES: hypothetical protein [unclassified Pseudoclavibacter]|uniref:hypothetical protein n=1 Tax=unclassified Pseudoclavibacter TaxID=2615177 RepID=UPI001BA80788|nr:hypothetical protein [Pseudoclavibacter sp. Marseille-Q4354]MBS3177255.1 hypothetical protein [Pseudoclavibacter sp. Marseille-Q4354]
MRNTDAANTKRQTGIKRRTLVMGAAWSVPTVMLAVGAPAASASANCTPQAAATIQANWQFNGNLGTWTTARTPGTAPVVEYSGTYNGLPAAALVVADPPTGVASSTTLTSVTACLAPGTYTFTFDARLYNANPRNLTLTASVRNVNSPATPLATTSFTTTTGAATSRNGNVLTVTVTQRTSVQFVYAWTFTATGTGAGDDIAVNAPRIAKTA